MRRGLSIDDLGDLVDLPLVAVLATYRVDGTVLLSRVARVPGRKVQRVHFRVGDIKTRHLRNDPRAVLLPAESCPPYRGVELTTCATLSQDDVPETVKRIAVRYLGPVAGRLTPNRPSTTSSSGWSQVACEPGTLPTHTEASGDPSLQET